MAGIDRRLRVAMSRVFPAAEPVALSPGHVEVGHGLDLGIGPGGGVESLPRTTILRPGDLLRVEFRFVNLVRSDEGDVPLLTRGDGGAPAYLIAGFGPQHLGEQAFFDPAGPVSAFPPAPPPQPKDAYRTKDPGGAEVPSYPVQARIAQASRVVYLVRDERIVFTEAGLLHAMRVLALSVAPHADGAPLSLGWREVAEQFGALTRVDERMRALRTSANRRLGARAGAAVRAGQGAGRARADRANQAEEPTPAFIVLPPARRAAALERIATTGTDLTELAEAARLRRTAAELEARFGASSAVAAVATELRPGIDTAVIPSLDLRPPVPREPTATETALEIPWRLQLSPHSGGAFTHALREVEHDGRVELWHSRLGSRTDAPADLDPATAPPVDEDAPVNRTVRAIWARDFTADNAAAKELGAIPTEDFGDLTSLPPFRSTLTARDRMQLVHLTSNHRYPRLKPQPASVERLMLTAAGGWLALEAHFDPTNAKGLSIEEWRHRATLGRDHYVKVVYQGVLLPFGHRASLVKVTERRVKDDGHATLYQRLFVIVREPERRFLASGRATYDNRMPLRWVRILTPSTPPLAAPTKLLGAADGQFFVPEIADVTGAVGAGSVPGQVPFHFTMVGNDVTNRLVEFEGPLIFVETTALKNAGTKDAVLAKANEHSPEYPFLAQRVAFAPPLDPDDTTLATTGITFDAEFDTATSERARNFVLPVMRVARAPVPAMAAFTGQGDPVALTYATAYRANAFGGGPGPRNDGGLFLELAKPDGTPINPNDAVPMGFQNQSQRSGGFVSPSVEVKALARRVGPVGGDLVALAGNAAGFDVGGMFGLDAAKLFGILPLSELLPASGSPLPTFVTQAVNSVVGLGQALNEARAFLTAQAGAIAGQSAQIQAAAAELLDAGQDFADALAVVMAPGGAPSVPTDFGALLTRIGTAAKTLVTGLRTATTAAGGAAAAAPVAVPRPDLERVFGVLDRLADAAPDAVALAEAIEAFATGQLLPERVSARLEWSTKLVPWAPSGVTPPVFQPEGDQTLRLVSEVQAPLRGGTPSTLVSCALPPFTVTLLGSTEFIAIHVTVMEFSVQPGRKTDVNVELSDGQEGRPEGIEFLGPLAFVETLKEIIPFDGFSDPPYLDIAPSGLKAGFDLEIPDLAVGVFALTNIHVGAELSVPFIGESLEFRFFFATRENPFRLQVAFFAGGGFFAITISPKGLKVIEAAFEFGAAVEMSFVVASGSLSVMAGIYFRLEVNGDAQSVQLTGYFRARGEVDVLGLISASIELYLELSYRSITAPDGSSSAKAVGKASISIEVSVCFLSFSVSVSCEKQFAGSSGDPTFLDTMGPYTDALGAAHDPWAEYCGAFAVEGV